MTRPQMKDAGPSAVPATQGKLKRLSKQRRVDTKAKRRYALVVSQRKATNQGS